MSTSETQFLDGIDVLDERERHMLELIQADDRVVFVALISGKRAIVKIPPHLIVTDDDVAKLRHGDPDIELLKRSVVRGGGDSTQLTSLWVSIRNEVLTYRMGDGAQRLRAITDAGTEWCFVQVMLAWENEVDAMEGSVDLNSSRYPMKDRDIFSMIRSNKISDDRIKMLTGFEDAKFRRYKLVADHEWMAELVSEECFGYSKAASLLQACDKNPERIAALKTELMKLKKQADEGVKSYKLKAKTGNVGLEAKKKQKLSTWFTSFKDRVADIQDAVKSDSIEEVNGVWQVIDNENATKLVATLGEDFEWEDKLALFNFFGRKTDDVPLESYDEVIDNWSNILKLVKQNRKRVAIQMGKPKPQPATAEIPSPTQQLPSSEVDLS